MRASISRLALLGTTRAITFDVGLNVVRGEIGTGKSTVLRLIYGLFGGGYGDLIPELARVTHVEGDIELGNALFRVARRPVSTADALVDVFGETEAVRLPAEAGSALFPRTFKAWVQQKLELPQFEVFPSERLDVLAAAVTIKDYFFYSYLRQSELGRSLLGSVDRFRSLKRRVVFAQVWGLTTSRYHELQVELRNSERRLSDAEARIRAAEEMFADTPWANTAALTAALESTETALRTLRQESAGANRAALLRGYLSGSTQLRIREGHVESNAAHVPAEDPSPVESLRRQVLQSDESIALLEEAIRQEEAAADELKTLAAQLEAQRNRLSKAIAARSYLLDYDFLVCPRCGTGVDAERRRSEGLGDGACYLCLQHPVQARLVTREHLEEEERRIGAQITESAQLSEAHSASAALLKRELAQKRADRHMIARDLDARTADYVSDNAVQLQTTAAAEAKLVAQLESLHTFSMLQRRLELMGLEARELSTAVEMLRKSAKAEESRHEDSDAGLREVDTEFTQAIHALDVPRLDNSEYVALDRDPDYLGPVVWGRRFNELHSPGAKTLVNVAFAASIQRAAITRRRPLANILLIDGLTNSLGDDADGERRKRLVWQYLVETAEEYRGKLQIIIADNDVPDFVEPFVRVTLSAADRLVP